MEKVDESENFIQNKFGYCFYSFKPCSYSLKPCPFIYNLYVHPQYRRCGHSKTLLLYVINEIRKTGYIGEINIQAKPKDNSINSNDLIKYYESMGLKTQI